MNIARPLYIFDLDGTLALNEHRNHFLQREKPDWRAFFAACDRDEPNEAVIRTLNLLRHYLADVWIWSGRSDEVRDKTVNWLAHHTSMFSHEVESVLRMRAEGDYTPDEVLKRQWLEAMAPADRTRLVAVFDDRDKVVSMWRAAGVGCFQVAPGAF